ncbi:MAG: hypothetical protein H0V17_08540 [Deltaproteobacteria bacterium]|nr:hypothetical protein [Deltaproteobacteria bacterium]
MAKIARYTQEWGEIEARFPGSSAAFDRDLGDCWLDGRDGPRFDQYGAVLKAFAGESSERGHKGPWASAYYIVELERWVITKDERGDPEPEPEPEPEPSSTLRRTHRR